MLTAAREPEDLLKVLLSLVASHCKPGEGQACSRSCGGGVYELRRAALAQA